MNSKMKPKFAVEFVEICPHCDGENIYDDYDIENGYVITCKHCGERILACDACSHSDDNTKGFCDWHISRKNRKYQVGCCFRGLTVNKM